MAYEFNGSDQRLNTVSASVTEPPFTIALWFNADNNSANQRLVDIRAVSSGNPYYSIGLGGNVAGGPLRFIVYTGHGGTPNTTAYTTLTTSGYSTGRWHHACAVAASASSRTVYLDAGNSATGTDSAALGATPSRIDFGVLTDGTGALSQFFDGRMAEVGIWSAALTAAEIASLAKGYTPAQIRPQSLVFYAPLIRDLVDVKGGLTITNNNNSATVAAHPRVYA